MQAASRVSIVVSSDYITLSTHIHMIRSNGDDNDYGNTVVMEKGESSQL